MFIVSLNYTQTLEKVDQHIAAHIAFLDHYYAAGKFIASGRKVPRTGGVILVSASSREEVETIIAEDPFVQAKVAEYEITQFCVLKVAAGFEQLLDTNTAG